MLLLLCLHRSESNIAVVAPTESKRCLPTDPSIYGKIKNKRKKKKKENRCQ